MNMSDFRQLARDNHIKQIRFVESSCSPLVIELTQTDNQRALLKDNHGEVMKFKNIAQAYDICREQGFHSAELVQIIPHDEACAGSFTQYDQQAIPLKF